MTLYTSTVKILVADNCEVIRLGLHALFSQHNNLKILAETDTFKATIDSIAHYLPDVLLIDPVLNDGDCLENLPKLLTASPKSKILLFTGNNDNQTFLHALRLGVAGIVSKQHSAALLLKAIHTVQEGQLWFDRNLTQILLQSQIPINENTSTDSSVNSRSNLSNREREIAGLASKGLSAKKISAKLFISEKTVRNNLTTIYEKLSVSGQVELCLLANQFDFSS
jgi:DNA-binding NarL/FixJ family response regulator